MSPKVLFLSNHLEHMPFKYLTVTEIEKSGWCLIVCVWKDKAMTLIIDIAKHLCMCLNEAYDLSAVLFRLFMFHCRVGGCYPRCFAPFCRVITQTVSSHWDVFTVRCKIIATFSFWFCPSHSLPRAFYLSNLPISLLSPLSEDEFPFSSIDCRPL